MTQFRYAFVLTALLYVSPIVGLLLDIITVRIFGITGVIDLYRLSISFVLASSGLISAWIVKYVIIPEMATFSSEGRNKLGLVFALIVTLAIITVMLPFLGYAVLRPGEMLIWLAPGLDRNLVELGAVIVRVSAVGIIVITLFGSATALLQFHGKIYSGPISQIMQNLALMACIVWLGARAVTQEQQIDAIAYSMLSSFVVAGVMLAAIVARLWMSLDDVLPSMSTIIAVLKTRAVVIGSVGIQLLIVTMEIAKSVVLNRTLSGLEEGSITIFNYCIRLLQLGSLPSIALSAIAFPSIARSFAGGNSAEIGDRLLSGVRALLVVSTFFSVLLPAMAHPIIGLLFFFARMNSGNQEALVQTYQVVCASTASLAMGLFLSEFCYACQQRGIILISSLASLLVTAILVPLLATQGQIGGVAIAYFTATFCTPLILVTYNALQGAFAGKKAQLSRFIGFWLTGAIVLIAVETVLSRSVEAYFGSSIVGSLLSMAALTALGGVVYLPFASRAIGPSPLARLAAAPWAPAIWAWQLVARFRA